ncbi:MAG: hypothetical protein ABI589_07240 [Burkholderiales bacterium]
MRTTITLEDDAFAVAQAYAQARALRLGQAISELIRRASTGPAPVKEKNGVWVFDLPAHTPRVSSRRVKELLEDFP